MKKKLQTVCGEFTWRSTFSRVRKNLKQKSKTNLCPHLVLHTIQMTLLPTGLLEMGAMSLKTQTGIRVRPTKIQDHNVSADDIPVQHGRGAHWSTQDQYRGKQWMQQPEQLLFHQQDPSQVCLGTGHILDGSLSYPQVSANISGQNHHLPPAHPEHQDFKCLASII